jgi:uncharacterized membrane protein (DUF485 family)
MSEERLTAITNGLAIIVLIVVWVYVWRANKALNKSLGLTKTKRKDRAK